MVRPVVIVAAGAYRSASTWQYNAIRLILEHAGQTVEYGGWRGEYQEWEELPSCDVLLVKEHKYYNDLGERANMIFTTERNWFEARKSWYRFEGKRLTQEEQNVRKIWLNCWMAHPNHVCHIVYEEFLQAPRACFDLIATALEDVVNPNVLYYGTEEAYKALCAIEPPKRGQDEKTLMFHNHITQ